MRTIDLVYLGEGVKDRLRDILFLLELANSTTETKHT